MANMPPEQRMIASNIRISLEFLRQMLTQVPGTAYYAEGAEATRAAILTQLCEVEARIEAIRKTLTPLSAS